MWVSTSHRVCKMCSQLMGEGKKAKKQDPSQNLIPRLETYNNEEPASRHCQNTVMEGVGVISVHTMHTPIIASVKGQAIHFHPPCG